jgi:hypothetical protein
MCPNAFVPLSQAGRVRAWLEGHRVLAKQRSARQIKLGEGALESDGARGTGNDGECAQWSEPCPLCGRTYFHVHKSSIRQGGGAAGGDDF